MRALVADSSAHTADRLAGCSRAGAGARRGARRGACVLDQSGRAEDARDRRRRLAPRLGFRRHPAVRYRARPAGRRPSGWHPARRGWAERVAVPQDWIAELPDGVSFAQAAALPTAGPGRTADPSARARHPWSPGSRDGRLGRCRPLRDPARASGRRGSDRAWSAAARRGRRDFVSLEPTTSCPTSRSSAAGSTSSWSRWEATRSADSSRWSIPRARWSCSATAPTSPPPSTSVTSTTMRSSASRGSSCSSATIRSAATLRTLPRLVAEGKLDPQLAGELSWEEMPEAHGTATKPRRGREGRAHARRIAAGSRPCGAPTLALERD